MTTYDKAINPITYGAKIRFSIFYPYSYSSYLSTPSHSTQYELQKVSENVYRSMQVSASPSKSLQIILTSASRWESKQVFKQNAFSSLLASGLAAEGLKGGILQIL